MSRSRFRLALALLAGADLVHRAVVAGLGAGELERDTLGYWRFGGDVAGGDLLLRQSEQVFRVPVYPWFVGLMRTLFGDGALDAIVVAQHALGFATSLLAAWLVWRCSRRPLPTLVAYLLSAVGVARVVYANQLMSETLFAFLLTATLAVLLEQARRPGAIGWPLLSGALLGLTTLVRPVTLLLPAVLFLSLLFQPGGADARGSRLRVGLRAFGLHLLGFLLVLAPWLIRNLDLTGRPALTRAQGRQCWVTTFGTTVSGAALDLPGTPESGLVSDAVDAVGGNVRHNFTVHSALVRGGATRWQADDLMQRVCVQAIRKQPVAYGRSLLRRLRVLWTATGERTAGEVLFPRTRPQTSAGGYAGLVGKLYRPSPWLALLYSLAAWAGALTLAVPRRRRHLGVFVLGTLIYVSLVSTTFGVPLYRYRMPLEPLLAVCVAALAGGRSKARERAVRAPETA